ncbi:MAG TPA: YceI family protein [Steroidobacteraceae bacterium]
MARALIPRLAACGIAFLAAGSAGAGAWHGDGTAGKLGFSAVQAGARFAGSFAEFTVDLDFDPAAPAQGRLHVRIATASADTQDDDRDGILRGPDFFWSGRHPEALYHAQGFKRDGKGWRALGELTLRGVTQPVAVHFTAAAGKGLLTMKGQATLRRLAFGVGQGDWASTEWIGDEVGIAFELSLSPAASATSP